MSPPSPPPGPRPFDMALEELRHLEMVIARHEDLAFKIRGWLFAILGALTIALFSKQLGWEPFLVAGIAITVLFIWVELLHRGVMRLAINRVRDVEAHLRAGLTNYDGPRICDSLQKSLVSGPLLFAEFMIATVCIPYAVVLGTIILLALSARPQ